MIIGPLLTIQWQVKSLEDALEESKSKVCSSSRLPHTSRLAIHDPQIRKQQSLLAAQHRDDDRRLDAELHSDRVEDNAVNVGQAVRSNLLFHIPSN